LTDPGDVARRWLAASNAGDVDAMIDLYSEEAVHESPKVKRTMPGSDGKLVGKAAIRAWWVQSIGGVPGLSYELSALTSDGSRAVVEYVRRGPGQEALTAGTPGEIAARMLATAWSEPRGAYPATGTPTGRPNIAKASTQHPIRR
jgi:hypothetical protein